MKRNVFGVLASVAIAGALVGAQAQSPTPQPPGAQAPTTEQPRSTPPASTQDRGSSVTLTGCLIQGSSPNVFLLENAKIGPASSSRSSTERSSSQGQSSSSSSSSSSSAGQAASMSGQTYVIEAAGSSPNLKNDLNHQVTITGTIAAASSSSKSMGNDSRGEAGRPESSSSSSSSSQSGSSVGQSSSSSSMTARDESTLPHITAKNVKKVADTCSAAD